MDIGVIWDLVILSPMINIVVVLSGYLFNSFGLTIIVLTIIIRGVMYPLTKRQLKATKAMQELQPKRTELRKKYAKDKQRLAKEEMALMKETGVSPQGCLVPMLIQFPIWIALYQSIIRVLAMAPEDFLNLSRHLYSSWTQVFSQVPLDNWFLGMNLAAPNMFLAIVVGATMWLQQKMTTPVGADPKQQAQSQMMLWMMPLMFTFLSFSFPSGLALYWVISNVIGIVMQYFMGGWGGLTPLVSRIGGTKEQKQRSPVIQEERKLPTKAATDADITPESLSEEEGRDYEKSGDKRQDSGRGYQDSLRSIRRQSRRSKRRRFK